ncbi:MAG TPA: 4'-phosphopantetheinyl transferase superfamily protein, partial [Gammaproteobacteria bacterium]|nr:4'-phosphopantetheinyl transferase superfamily protein [Gammaproteobacteria bacterium]
MTHRVQIMFMEQAHAPFTETALLSRLHPDEQARYRGFTHGPRRLSWLAGRALMLAALEKVLGTVDARALRSRESGGVAYGAGVLHLNLSHSGELLGVALSNLPIGFDLERPRPRAVVRSAGRIFSAQEAAWIDALPALERLDGFYSLWTLKEAACKAVELTLWDCMKTARFELPDGRFSPQAPLLAGPWS